MNYYIITFMSGKDRLIIGEFADTKAEFMEKINPKPTTTYIIKKVSTLSNQAH